MKLNLKPEMTLEAMQATIQAELPQYETTIKKNPLMGFQFLQIKKSGSVGVWVRPFEKKGRLVLTNCMPSTMVRAFFGGLLLLIFVWGAQSRVRKETGAVLINKFGTSEQ